MACIATILVCPTLASTIPCSRARASRLLPQALLRTRSIFRGPRGQVPVWRSCSPPVKDLCNIVLTCHTIQSTNLAKWLRRMVHSRTLFGNNESGPTCSRSIAPKKTFYLSLPRPPLPPLLLSQSSKTKKPEKKHVFFQPPFR